MLLSLDIGNSFTKAGLFESGVMLEFRQFPNPEVNELLKWIGNYSIQACISSATSVIQESMRKGLKKSVPHYLELDHRTPIPIRNGYRTPETLGRDRLAGAVGAYSMFPDEAALIIDAGTCVTYDILSEDNIFLGGWISPGLQMRFQAMHHFTAKLPLVTTPNEVNMIGKTTEEAMANGGFGGLVLEMNGVIERHHSLFPELRVIITGGDAKVLAEQIKTQIFVVPNLVLEGLLTILRFNLGNED